MTLRFFHAADLHVDSPLRGLDRYEGAPVERLRGATRRALVELLKLGIDTAHPLHGELVRKAIEALVPLALSGKDSGALFVAYLAAVGKRTRKMVRDAVEKLGLGQALVAKLTDEAALRKEVLG